MRGFLLFVALFVVVNEQFAQSPTSYSGGLPLLKRRPFKPEPAGEGNCAASAPFVEGWGARSFPRVIYSRGPIDSPYSMIRYTTPTPSGEALPPPATPAESKRPEATAIPVEPIPAPRRAHLPSASELEHQEARPNGK